VALPKKLTCQPTLVNIFINAATAKLFSNRTWAIAAFFVRMARLNVRPNKSANAVIKPTARVENDFKKRERRCKDETKTRTGSGHARHRIERLCFFSGQTIEPKRLPAAGNSPVPGVSGVLPEVAP